MASLPLVWVLPAFKFGLVMWLAYRAARDLEQRSSDTHGRSSLAVNGPGPNPYRAPKARDI